LEKFCAEMTHIWPRKPSKETREGNRRGRGGLEIVLEIVLGDGLGGGLIIPGPHAAPGLALRRDPMPRWIAPRSIQI